MFIARYWVHSMRVLKLNMLSKFMQYTSSKLATFSWRSVTYYHKNTQIPNTKVKCKMISDSCLPMIINMH